MSAIRTQSLQDFLANLTEAAYSVALKHGIRGAFIDVQLGMWKALGSVIDRENLALAVRRIEHNGQSDQPSITRLVATKAA